MDMKNSEINAIRDYTMVPATPALYFPFTQHSLEDMVNGNGGLTRGLRLRSLKIIRYHMLHTALS